MTADYTRARYIDAIIISHTNYTFFLYRDAATMRNTWFFGWCSAIIMVALWRSNEQTTMFYSCDLSSFIYFSRSNLIFKAEERRAAGPLPGCRYVV